MMCGESCFVGPAGGKEGEDGVRHAGRVHPDPFVASRQQVTRDWWRDHAAAYDVFISQLVIEESSEGDPSAVAERLEVVKDLDLPQLTDEVDDSAAALVAEQAVPGSEPRDTFHIAIAAVDGVDCLLTWNYKHLANATLRSRVELLWRDAGFAADYLHTDYG